MISLIHAWKSKKTVGPACLTQAPAILHRIEIVREFILSPIQLGLIIAETRICCGPAWRL
jgi:hypothetical protein